jgi:prevent-host-death family protein
MKTISIRDLQARIKKCVDQSQNDSVVITRHGKPAALLIGLEGLDWEHVVLETNAAFWRLIQARRHEKTIPLEEMKARLDARSRAVGGGESGLSTSSRPDRRRAPGRNG